MRDPSTIARDFDVRAMFDAMDTERRRRDLSWRDVARQVHCSESQLRGLRTVRYAIAMLLAMRLVTWLDRPASAFIVPEKW